MILKSVLTWSSTRSQTRAWVVSPNVRLSLRPWLTVTSATVRRTRCSSTTATRTWRTSSTSTAAERSTSPRIAVPWPLWRIWSTGGSKRRALSHAVSNDGWSARSRQDHHNHDHLHSSWCWNENKRAGGVGAGQGGGQGGGIPRRCSLTSHILNFKSGCFNPASFLLSMSCFYF